MERAATTAFVGLAILAIAAPASAQTLRGSPHAMQQQHRVALQHDYTFIQTSAQLRRFVDLGLLVRMPGNADYELAAVSHPYARPAVKLFIERLASQYRSACGEKLVVTSLTRPVREQPRNASDLSVHPAGMAVDLRVSQKSSCRRWLESTLLTLERQGVLNAIRENRPPHYHVALYPTSYTQYVTRITRGSVQVAAAAAPSTRAEPTPAESSGTLVTANLGTEAVESAGPSADPVVSGDAELLEYRVNRGDSLWSIARRHGTTVDTLKQLNGLRSSAIIAGQTLTVPVVASDDASSTPDSSP